MRVKYDIFESGYCNVDTWLGLRGLVYSEDRSI
jgi:hypothetical protein